MPEERNRKISSQLASQGAPTFLRVKPSSLMMLCPEDTEVLEVQTRKAGVIRCLLYRGNQRDMWLLYREEELNEILKKRKCAGFFRQWAILLFLFRQFSITSGCVFWSIGRTRGNTLMNWGSCWAIRWRMCRDSSGTKGKTTFIPDTGKYTEMWRKQYGFSKVMTGQENRCLRSC